MVRITRLGLLMGRKADEPSAVFEVLGHRAGHLQCDARLARAACASERD
jgi:hypothetical protein